jgi:predicted amidohydrolase YtcJ
MYPDLILYNGTICTQDDSLPFARAVAVSGNRVLAVGDDADILSCASNETRIIDLEKKLVLPGFIDSHFHFYEFALNYNSIDFSKVSTFGEMEEAVLDKTQQIQKGGWILGQGFNESDWPENRMPDRQDLDRVAPDHPVCIWRCDLHVAVANSMALKRAGIGPGTPDPPGGVIVKDGTGTPTGVLRELAANLIKDAVPEQSDETVMQNMQKAVKDVQALGITSIHDIRLMGGRDGEDALRLWQKLHTEDRLDIRCHVALPGEMTDQAIERGLRTGVGDDRLRIGHLKFFADGGMGARTAWMKEKYLDAEYGMPLTEVDEIEAAIIKADPAGLSVMVHCVGTKANQNIIDMFERFERKNAIKPLIPHRIEHLQMIEPEDLAKMATLHHVVASCQPNNLSLDISMIQICVGEKGKYTYMLKSILDSGIPLMLSSDAPVCDPNPLPGIYSAVTRKRMNRTPEKGWHMEQALTVEEAVKGYTITPAIASGVGDRLGSISKNKLADMIVLNWNIFTGEPDEIADVTVDLTIFDGKVVWPE